MSDFNAIAPYYDSIVKLIFGNSLIKIQQLSLKYLSSGRRVLIIGGGTGRVFKGFEHQCKSILYLEPSEKMILQAKKNLNIKYVTFRKGKIEKVPPTEKFDLVITNFVMDIFSRRELEQFIGEVESRMASGCLWIVSDFSLNKSQNYYHLKKRLVQLMSAFFSITSNLRNNQLYDYRNELSNRGYDEIQCYETLGGFVFSSIFQERLSSDKGK